MQVQFVGNVHYRDEMHDDLPRAYGLSGRWKGTKGKSSFARPRQNGLILDKGIGKGCRDAPQVLVRMGESRGMQCEATHVTGTRDPSPSCRTP